MTRLLFGVMHDLGEPSVDVPPFVPSCLGVENLPQQRVGEPQAPTVHLEHPRFDRRVEVRDRPLARADDLLEHAHGRLRAGGDHKERSAHVFR